MQKLSFAAFRGKTVASIAEMSAMADNGHPGQSRTSLPMDGQQLSPSELAELRDACALLGRQVSMAAQALEDSRNRREANTRSKKGKNSAKRSSHTRASKSESQARPSGPHDNAIHVAPLPPSKSPAPMGYVPVSVASHTNRLSTQGADEIDPDPLALVRVPKSRCQVNPAHLATRIGLDLPGRPATSACVSGDHFGSSRDTSHDHSQTATTMDQPSTRLSSWSSPANEGKSSPGSNCVSEQISPHRLSTSAASVAAKTWMMQERAHRQSHSSSGRTVRPGSCGPTPYKPAGTDRPGSRAGTIKDTLRDYIRPRPSSDAVHPTARFETNLRRFDSRRGQESHGGGSNWWRGSGWGNGKGRNSFRDAQMDDASPFGTEGPPNLNRELPALPGLDQYRERKLSATHVAQLMRPKPATVKPTDEPPQHGETAEGQRNCLLDPALVESERIRHQEAVQRAMEDRMRHHTQMASVTVGPYARQKEHAAAQKRAQTTVMPSSPGLPGREAPPPKVSVMPDQAPPPRPRGFRNRMSRLLRRGGGGKGDGR